MSPVQQGIILQLNNSQALSTPRIPSFQASSTCLCFSKFLIEVSSSSNAHVYSLCLSLRLGYPKVVTPSGPAGSIVGAASGTVGGAVSGIGTCGAGTGSSTNLTVAGAAGANTGGVGSGSGGAGGSASPMRRQSSARGLDSLVPPGRTGSFRGRNSPNPTSPDKPCFSVWKRRPSWPEVEIKSSSG